MHNLASYRNIRSTMQIGRTRRLAFSLTVTSCVIASIFTLQAAAQQGDLMEKLEQIKQASAANKQALAKYTWQEQQTISLKGEVKKTTIYQVSTGPDGTQQKTEISSTPAAAPPSGGKFKQKIIAKKKEEYQEYGEQIADLAKQYSHPDPQAMQQAYQKGNVSLQMGGAAGTVSLVFKNYLKPSDSMTIVFNTQDKGIQAINVSSYLTDPSDAVTESVQFAKLPSGVNHVATVQVNGVAKQLGVNIQNSNYQPKGM
jgi:hypothetical protein